MKRLICIILSFLMLISTIAYAESTCPSPYLYSGLVNNYDYISNFEFEDFDFLEWDYYCDYYNVVDGFAINITAEAIDKTFMIHFPYIPPESVLLLVDKKGDVIGVTEYEFLSEEACRVHILYLKPETTYAVFLISMIN